MRVKRQKDIYDAMQSLEYEINTLSHQMVKHLLHRLVLVLVRIGLNARFKKRFLTSVLKDWAVNIVPQFFLN